MLFCRVRLSRGLLRLVPDNRQAPVKAISRGIARLWLCSLSRLKSSTPVPDITWGVTMVELQTLFIWSVVILDGLVLLYAIAWIVSGGWHRKKPFDLQEFRSSLTRDDRVNPH